MKFYTNRSLSGKWPVILAGLIAVAGLCISLYLRSRIAQTESAAARLAAENLRLNTEQELGLFAEVLESVGALHALSDKVNQAAMDEFIEKGLVHQRAVLGAFGLTQRINPWMRAVLDEQTKANPGTGYQFLQQDPDGTWITAGSQPVYYPLTWQNRTNALNIPVGFDFYSLSEARPVIERIEQTRQTALVPVPVSFAGFSPQSYWVFAPVLPRQSGDRLLYAPDTVIGLAVAVLHPETILQRVAARSAWDPELRLTLADMSGPDAKETIRFINGSWIYRYPLNAVGTQWIFECSLPSGVTGRRSGAALAAGLIITALVASLILILGSRTRKIEAEVRARTEELRIAGARLEEHLLERARLEEEMNELAARERRKIGRDLHDSLGQKLTGAVFLSRSLLDHFLTGKDHKSPITHQETHARTLNETLKSAVAQVRSMARGLAPVTLNDESLSEALEQLAEEMTGMYGVSCEVVECSGSAALSRKTKEQLYLIAREAVNNAARHAQAGHVTVRMAGNETGWELRIEDNGKGMPPEQPAGEGMGIRIMRHRAGLIGAQLTLSSVPGKGTHIKVSVNT